MNPSFAPLFAASPAIQIHAVLALAAFVVGLVQFAAPKGTPLHRALGWLWVLGMAVVALSSFLIHEIRLWGAWSPIHLLSVWVLLMLVVAIHAARHGAIERHRKTMRGLFVGALVIAGLFTLMPGRIMHAVLFGA
ncbi:DUF2306 domain-containing protein [Prosthecomicrobium hirschii]|uniref:DUF2306 domain-containing protein n=1 Tax=Prosthecodimorpha hirschii TaxID=665126 RepID=UPI00112CBBB8|nr:DUF2306 domain-containing protein [Prosthecomicrobium hirschii]MCW1839978.1 DUF2306 domain-containing protein [Prosthecomicrobium hirschii]TPQ52104.1 hypothetical protein C2U72_04910 [Prosthecomicrobium hirschii]